MEQLLGSFLLEGFPSLLTEAWDCLFPLCLFGLFLIQLDQFTDSPSFLSETSLVPWSSSHLKVMLPHLESISCPLEPTVSGMPCPSDRSLSTSPSDAVLEGESEPLYTTLLPFLDIGAALGLRDAFLRDTMLNPSLPSHVVHTLRKSQIGRNPKLSGSPDTHLRLDSLYDNPARGGPAPA